MLRRQRLQEHHDLLKVHTLELFGPLYQECGAYVKMKGRETLIFGLRAVDQF